MKVANSAIVCSMLLSSVSAFTPELKRAAVLSRPFMFGGAGEGVPGDDPEEERKMEEAAKAMGMSLDEYKLGVRARIRLTKVLDDARVSAGSSDKVSVERDANNPPKFLEIKITDAGKALGKDGVSTELVAALKTSSEESRKKRGEAQREMMAFISDEMKSMGIGGK